MQAGDRECTGYDVIDSGTYNLFLALHLYGTIKADGKTGRRGDKETKRECVGKTENFLNFQVVN